MNPNFLNNMSPEQIRQMQNMVTPDMMKGMNNQLASMTDAQLGSYLTSMGMGHVSPQMFRSMSSNMGNMNETEFNNMKNSGGNYAGIGKQFTPPQTSSFTPSQNQTLPMTEPKNFAEKLEWIKRQGNDFFKQKLYREACDKYYEVINEIQLSSDEDKIEFKEQLKDLERISRLNIANCKLSLNEFDGVINECLKVLENDKCFKAYYRLGVALLKKGKIDKAYEYLEKAKSIGTSEEKKAIDPYLKECDVIKKKDKEKEKDIPKEEPNQQSKLETKKEKDKGNEQTEINKTGATKLEKMNEILQKEREEQKNKKTSFLDEPDGNEEPTIESIKTDDHHHHQHSNNCSHNQSNYQQPQYGFPNQQCPYGQSPEQMKEKIASMSDNDMSSMINTMKAMDNDTIRNMLQSQGMNISPEQIEMMKNCMTPDTLKMLKNTNMPMPNMPNYSNPNVNASQSMPSTSQVSTQPPQQSSSQGMPSQMPNLGNMDFKSMLNFVKSNPEMLKMISPQLSQMMGGKDANPELMMNAMEKILWIFSIPSEIKRFCTSRRGICIIILIIGLIYAYFKK